MMTTALNFIPKICVAALPAMALFPAGSALAANAPDIIAHSPASALQMLQRVRSATPRGDRLICRGGGGILPIIAPKQRGTEIIFRYRAAPKSWMDSNGEIGEGQCTWMRRTISATDPAFIKLVISAQGSSSVNWKAFFVPGKRFRSTSFEQRVFALRTGADGPVIDVMEQTSNTGQRRFSNVMRLDFRGDQYFMISASKVGDNLVSNGMTKGKPMVVRTRPRTGTTTQQGDGTPQRAEVRVRRER